MNAYVIEKATAEIKTELSEIVGEMNAEEPCRVSVGESSRFVLNGLNAVEVFTDYYGCQAEIEWHFVKCECGNIDIRHGEEDECYCSKCNQLQEVHSRTAQRLMGVKWV